MLNSRASGHAQFQGFFTPLVFYFYRIDRQRRIGHDNKSGFYIKICRRYGANSVFLNINTIDEQKSKIHRPFDRRDNVGKRYLPALFHKHCQDERNFSFPRMLGDLLGGGNRNPVVDLRENGDELILSADISGFDPRDLDITVDGSVVILKGNRRREEIREQPGYYFAARSRHSFYRVIPLPADVKSEKTVARCNNGVLELKMVKGKTFVRSFKPLVVSEDNS